MPFIKNVTIFARKVAAGVVLPQISAGRNHAFFIRTTGRLFGWGGNNPNGQVGDNTTQDKCTPVSVAGAVKTFCKISAGNLFSLSIDKNGRAWAWGNNSRQQLGENTTQNRCTPVSVLGAVKTFCEISAGGEHSVAIDKNGRAWAWGYNLLNQLGDTTTTQRATPVSVAGVVKTFCKISAGGYHTSVIDNRGRAWSWGYNNVGQLGDNTTTQRATPVSVLGVVKTFCEIFANINQLGSQQFTVAISNLGRVWGWGENSTGQLGDNTLVSKRTPVSVLGTVKTFCKIAAGRGHVVSIDKNGRVWSWGSNSNGQLGINSTVVISRLTPVSVLGAVKTFCSISAGEEYSLAVDKNGNAWAWGAFSSGQLGNALYTSYRSPVSLGGVSKTFCRIEAANDVSYGIDKNGRVWAWGQGTAELGDNGVAGLKNTPVSVAGAVKTFCKISGGANHALAISRTGRAWAWGLGANGRLGNNATSNVFTPVSVAGTVKTFCEIYAGYFHSVAIDNRGRAWSWGFNGSGQLGNASTLSQNTPVSVLGNIKTFCRISAGNAHTVAISNRGRVWVWGSNSTGQLGDNSITSRLTPVSVAGAVKTFCIAIAANLYTVAIDNRGRAWSWGSNSSGQLGDNTTTSRLTPVSVLGAVKTFCKIAATTDRTMAIDRNGRAWGWGNNSAGVLGDGTTTQRNTPVSVGGLVKTFCEIFAGSNHTIALDKNGRIWSWGFASNGVLGDNTGTRLTPVRVCTL